MFKRKIIPLKLVATCKLNKKLSSACKSATVLVNKLQKSWAELAGQVLTDTGNWDPMETF